MLGLRIPLLDNRFGAGGGTRTPNPLFTSQTDSDPPGVASCPISRDLRIRPRRPCQIVRQEPPRPGSVAAFPSPSLPQIPSINRGIGVTGERSSVRMNSAASVAEACSCLGSAELNADVPSLEVTAATPREQQRATGDLIGIGPGAQSTNSRALEGAAYRRPLWA